MINMTKITQKQQAEMYKVPSKEISARLEYLRGEIENERISYGEIAELIGLVEYIEPGDTLLLEWADVMEFEDEEILTCNVCAGLSEKEKVACKHYELK